MSGKDSAIVGAVFFDKQRLIRNQPTTISGTVDAHLMARLKQFEEIGRQLQARTIDGEVIQKESESEPRCLVADSGKD